MSIKKYHCPSCRSNKGCKCKPIECDLSDDCNKIDKIKHTFILQVVDGSGFPYAGLATFNYTVVLKIDGKEIVSMYAPQLNFETLYTYAPDDYVMFAPLGGFVTTAAQSLPEMFRPKHDLTFIVANNDGFLQSIDFTTYTPGTPPIPGNPPTPGTPSTGVTNPVPGYKFIIDSYGNLTIAANGTYGDIIPPGGHTMCGTIVPYQTKLQKCHKHCRHGFNEFIIQPKFTNFSLFATRAANDGIRDSHINDAYGNLAAWSWSDNSIQIDKSNNVMDAYVNMGDIVHGRVIPRAPINISNLFLQQMVWDTSIAINRNQTMFPGNVVASFDRLNHNTSLTRSGNVAGPLSMTIINIDTTYLNIGYLITDSLGYVQHNTTIASIPVSGTSGQITLSLPTTYAGVGQSPIDTFTITTGVPFTFMADILTAGSNKISNINSSDILQLVAGQTILDTGGYIPPNTTIVSVLVTEIILSNNMTNGGLISGDTFIVPRTWATPGSFAPGTPMVAVSNNGGVTFGPSFLLDPTIDFPAAVAADCPGVQCDKYGNMWYLINVDKSGQYLAENIMFYVSSDGGNTWSLFFETTDGTISDGFYDDPQFCFGNDGLGNYGIWFEGDYFTTTSAYFNNELRLGFIPIDKLNPTPLVGPATNYYTIVTNNQPNLLNTLTIVSIAAKNDGTVFLETAVLDTNALSYVGPIVIFVKPPGGFNTPLIGPWTIDQITNQWGIPTASYPYGLSRPYFPVSVKNMIVDDARGAIYAIITERLNFYSQNYNIFFMVSLDNGITWSEKFPLTKTVFQNRGFPSATLNSSDGALYVGYYDARNVDNNPPVGTVPHSSLQYFGVQLTKKYLDKLVNSLRN